VSADGAKNPPPTDARVVQALCRSHADTRGLKKVPNSLCTSTRPLAESASHRLISMSSWTKAPGTL
jgi:hypothetical protein